MCISSNYCLLPLFCRVLSNKDYCNFPIDDVDKSELEQTYQLCKSIIDVVDDYIINNKGWEQSLKYILEKYQYIEGFESSCFALSIQKYLYYLATEKDNDFKKSEAAIPIHNCIFKMRRFVEEVESKKY